MTEPLMVAGYGMILGAVFAFVAYGMGHAAGYRAGTTDGYRQGRRDEMKAQTRAHMPYWGRGDEP